MKPTACKAANFATCQANKNENQLAGFCESPQGIETKITEEPEALFLWNFVRRVEAQRFTFDFTSTAQEATIESVSSLQTAFRWAGGEKL